MKKAIWAVALLVLAGLMAVPTDAAELRVTGFFDNILPHADRNLSMADQDLTKNKDTDFTGRERSRLFFNFIASDDLRGIFALEIDQNVLELKNLYVDFRIPQLAISNRWQLGGFPADVTPLHPHLLYTMDAG